jgi:hypothetical protein
MCYNRHRCCCAAAAAAFRHTAAPTCQPPCPAVCLPLAAWQYRLLHLPHLLIVRLAAPALPAVRTSTTTKQQPSTTSTGLRLLRLTWLCHCAAFEIWLCRELGALREFHWAKHFHAWAGVAAGVDACRQPRVAAAAAATATGVISYTLPGRCSIVTAVGLPVLCRKLLTTSAKLCSGHDSSMSVPWY